MRYQPLVFSEPEPPGCSQGTKHREALLTLLQHVHTYPTAIQSDLAREYAQEVAEAASRGMITTAIVPGELQYGRVWKITISGLRYLYAGSVLIAPQELAAYNAHH
jgi:hypothetical protein